MKVGGQRHAQEILPPPTPQGKRTVTHFIGAVWALGSFWTGEGNISRTGIRYPDRPARSESLYILSSLGPLTPQLTLVIGGKWWKRVHGWLRLVTERGHNSEWLEAAYKIKPCDQDFALSLVIVVGSLKMEHRKASNFHTRNARLNSWKFVLEESEMTGDGMCVCAVCEECDLHYWQILVQHPPSRSGSIAGNLAK